MRTLFTLLVLNVLSANLCFSQELPFIGAKSLGTGSAVAAVPDHWSIFNSIGGTGMTDAGGIVSGFDQLYGIEGLNRVYLGYLQKTQTLGISAGFIRFGDQVFSQSRLSIGIGHQLGIAGLGLRFNYHQVMAEGYETQIAYSIDFGGIAVLSPNFLIGAELRNFTQSKYSNSTGTSVPVSFKCGVNIIPTEGLHLLIEIDKELAFESNLKFGLAYSIIDALELRTGINSNPQKMFFGIGFNPGNLMIDYGFGHQNDLGAIHSIGLGYKFEKKDDK